MQPCYKFSACCVINLLLISIISRSALDVFISIFLSCENLYLQFLVFFLFHERTANLSPLICACYHYRKMLRFQNVNNISIIKRKVFFFHVISVIHQQLPRVWEDRRWTANKLMCNHKIFDKSSNLAIKHTLT